MAIDWKDGFLMKYGEDDFTLYHHKGARVASTQKSPSGKLNLDCCLKFDRKFGLLYELTNVLYYKNEENEYIVKVPRKAKL